MAFKDVLQAVLDGFIGRYSLREVLSLTIGGLDHSAQRTPLEKSNLAELLLAHLFIRSAFQLFGPSLVDNMGDFILRQLATQALFFFGHGGVPFLGPLRELFNELGRDALDLERRAGPAQGITKVVQRL